MKHLQKFVALVLALACLFSLTLTAGAAAVEYKDANKITAAAAVNVLTELGIVNGYEDKNFKPLTNVTRAEMAKMLAFTLNGGKDVSEEYAGFCTFADSADHWAKGYIGFCVTAGLINGKNASTFDPDANVTGYEAAKMMLCALGYNAEFNGLTGKNWNTNAHLLAVKAGLLSMIADYKPAKELNRNDSCQMIYNTLRGTMVDTTGSSTTVGDFTVNDNVQNVERVFTTSDYTDTIDGKLQLVEDLFPTLKKVGGDHDAFGRPSSTWALAGKTLGSFVDTPAVIAKETSTNAKAIRSAIGGVIPESITLFQDGYMREVATMAGLEAKMGLSEAQIKALSAPDFWALANQKINGVANGAYAIMGQILRNDSNTLNYANGGVSGGSLMSASRRNEVYYNAETGALTCCTSVYYTGKISSITPDAKDASGNTIPGYITIDNSKSIGYSGAIAKLKLDDHNEVPGLASAIPARLSDVTKVFGKDLDTSTYVIYYVGQSTDPNNSGAVVLGAKVLDYVEGVVTDTTVNSSTGAARTYAQSFVADGTKYNRAAKSVTTAELTVRGPQDIGRAFRIYTIDLEGTILFFFVEPAISNQVYVYDAGKTTGGYNPKFTAKVIDAEGAVSIVNTDIDYGPAGSISGGGLVGCVALMSTDNMGRTVLTKLGSKSGATAQISVTNSDAAVRFDGTRVYADTETVFVISTITEEGVEIFTPYTGINEVPSLVGCKYYAYTTDDLTGRLKTVFVQEAILGDPSAEKEGVIMKTGNEICRNGEFGEYYEIAAIVNNELTTLKVSMGAYNQMGTGFTLFCSYVQGNGGIINGFTKLNATKINNNGFAPVADGNVTINGTAMLAHDNILVYTYSLRDKQLKIATIGDLMELQYGTYDSFYTCHENITGKPLACIVAVVE